MALEVLYSVWTPFIHHLSLRAYHRFGSCLGNYSTLKPAHKHEVDYLTQSRI